jgi:hypothetical protein
VRNAAAICDRPALWTQTKSTDGRSSAMDCLREVEWLGRG